MKFQTQRLSSGLLLFLPLPPSNNDLHVPYRRGYKVGTRRSAEADDYIEGVGRRLLYWRIGARFQPITDYRVIELWFILPRTSCDCHNYGKILFDAMQKGKVVVNDRYLIPRIMGIFHDSKDPHVAVKL